MWNWFSSGITYGPLAASKPLLVHFSASGSIRARSAAGTLPLRLARKLLYCSVNSPVHMTARSGPVFEIAAACSCAK